MRALVTGGAGFIGSAVVDRLVGQGDEVTVIDDLSRGRLANLAEAGDLITFVQEDIQDSALADIVATAKPEVIYHLAAQIDVRASLADPANDARINILGTIKFGHGSPNGRHQEDRLHDLGRFHLRRPDPAAGVRERADQPTVPRMRCPRWRASST